MLTYSCQKGAWWSIFLTMNSWSRIACPLMNLSSAFILLRIFSHLSISRIFILILLFEPFYIVNVDFCHQLPAGGDFCARIFWDFLLYARFARVVYFYARFARVLNLLFINIFYFDNKIYLSRAIFSLRSNIARCLTYI